MAIGIKYRLFVADNQCLHGGTLVSTSKGPMPIRYIKPDDIVYDEYGKPIKVLDVFYSGKKTVYPVVDVNTNEVLANCTPGHMFTEGNYDMVKAIGMRDSCVLLNSVNGKVACKFDLNYSDKVDTYDIHVDSPRNLYCLANGLITHNSGKTILV